MDGWILGYPVECIYGLVALGVFLVPFVLYRLVVGLVQLFFGYDPEEERVNALNRLVSHDMKVADFISLHRDDFAKKEIQDSYKELVRENDYLKKDLERKGGHISI